MTNDPKNPNGAKDDLVAYLDGELDDSATQQVEERIGRDPKTRSELDSLKRTWDLLDHLPRPAPPLTFTHQTMDRLAGLATRPTAIVASGTPQRLWLRPVAWAAAVLVAFGIGFGGIRLLGPPRIAQEQPTASAIDAEALARDRRVIENHRLYEHAVSLEFLKELANPDDPDLFGDNAGS